MEGDRRDREKTGGKVVGETQVEEEKMEKERRKITQRNKPAKSKCLADKSRHPGQVCSNSTAEINARFCTTESLTPEECCAEAAAPAGTPKMPPPRQPAE